MPPRAEAEKKTAAISRQWFSRPTSSAQGQNHFFALVGFLATTFAFDRRFGFCLCFCRRLCSPFSLYFGRFLGDNLCFDRRLCLCLCFCRRLCSPFSLCFAFSWRQPLFSGALVFALAFAGTFATTFPFALAGFLATTFALTGALALPWLSPWLSPSAFAGTFATTFPFALAGFTGVFVLAGAFAAAFAGFANSLLLPYLLPPFQIFDPASLRPGPTVTSRLRNRETRQGEYFLWSLLCRHLLKSCCEQREPFPFFGQRAIQVSFLLLREPCFAV